MLQLPLIPRVHETSAHAIFQLIVSSWLTQRLSKQRQDKATSVDFDPRPMVSAEFSPTAEYFAGLEEDWVRDDGITSGLHSWHLRHSKRSDTCLLVMSTTQFQSSPPRSQVDPLPYDIASTYINLAYALRRGYDFFHVHMPAAGVLQRVIPWYKIPVWKQFASHQKQYMLYIDMDATSKELIATSSSHAKLIQVGKEQYIYGDDQATMPTFIRHITSPYGDELRTHVNNVVAAKAFTDLVHAELQRMTDFKSSLKALWSD